MFLKHTFVNPGGSKSKNWSFRQKEKSNFVFEGVLNTDFLLILSVLKKISKCKDVIYC